MSEELKTLGSGSFGSVYLKTLNGLDYAIKIIDVEEKAYSAIREAMILLYLFGTQGVLQIKSFFVKGDNMIIATELAKGEIKDLDIEFIKSNFPKITYQLVQGLYNIHMKGVLHRDIKPSNIFYTDTPFLRVFYGDFGIARLGICDKPLKYISKAYSLYYRSPELLEAKASYEYGSKADIWALGVTLVEIVRGVNPFTEYRGGKLLEDTESSLKARITNVVSDEKFWSHLTFISSVGFANLIRKMLVIDLEKRINITSLIQDPFISTKGFKPIGKCSESFDTRVFNYKQVTLISQNRIEAIKRLLLKFEKLRLGMDTVFLSLCYFDLLTQGKSVTNPVDLMNVCIHVASSVEEITTIDINDIFFDFDFHLKLMVNTRFLIDKTIMALDKFLYTVTPHDYVILDQTLKGSEKFQVIAYLILLRLAYPNTFYHPRILKNVACSLAGVSHSVDYKIEKVIRENFGKFYLTVKDDQEFSKSLKTLGLENYIERILLKK